MERRQDGDKANLEHAVPKGRVSPFEDIVRS